MSLNSPCPPPGPSSWSDTRAMLAGWGTPRVGPKPVGRGFPWRAPARHQHLQGGSRERHPNSTGRTRRDSAWEAQAGTAACRPCPCRGTPYGAKSEMTPRGAAGQFNPGPRKPSFRQPWATGGPPPPRPPGHPGGAGRSPSRDTVPRLAPNGTPPLGGGGQSKGAPLGAG